MDDQDKTPAPEPEAAPAADAVSVRRDGARTVASAAGVDLMERWDSSPERYTLLRDFPRWGWKAGEVKALAEPHDEQAMHTARELAAETA